MRSGRDFVRGASYDERRSSASVSTYSYAYFSRTTFKLIAIFAFFTCCVVARLVWLQVVDAQKLTHMAQTQRTNVVKLFARRGTIYDRNGNVLAISRECKTLYCNPQQVKDPSGAAHIIADVLGGSADDYIDSLNANTTFSYVVKRISNEDAKTIKTRLADAKIGGVFLLPDIKREYPYGNVGGQILGLVGNDGDGLSGLELYYNDKLKGTDGEMIFEAGVQGTPIAGDHPHVVPAQHGNDIVISIDINIQKKAEDIIAQGVKDYHAKSGSVIATDPQNGEILAMCSTPLFNPTNAEDIAEGSLNLKPVSSTYEPGSIFKILTMSIGLDAQKISPQQVFDIPATIKSGAYTITDEDNRRVAADMDIREILRRSSNVGSSYVAQHYIGADTFAAGLDNFLIGQKTGIDYPGEVGGLVKKRVEYDGASLGTMAFGQALAFPQVQMAQAVGSVANGGTLYTPHFLMSTAGEEANWPAKGTSIKKETSDLMIDYLQTVVSEGTAKKAQVPGYSVAGKTGTGEQASPTGGYIRGSYTSSLIGFAPAKSAKILLYVGLDGTPHLAATSSAYLFSEIMREALTDLNISEQK